MLWIGEVEDAESVDDLITSASTRGTQNPDLENLDSKIAGGLGRSLQGTSRNNQRRDQLQADRFLG